MHVLITLMARLAQAWRQQPSLPSYPLHDSPMGTARSPAHDELGRRPGQVSWLVARAVTLQYR